MEQSRLINVNPLPVKFDIGGEPTFTVPKSVKVTVHKGKHGQGAKTKNVRPDKRYVALERNPAIVEILERRYAADCLKWGARELDRLATLDEPLIVRLPEAKYELAFKPSAPIAMELGAP